MRAPTTITITISPAPGDGYRAHLTGWGVSDVAGYGSQWSRDVPLEGVSHRSTSREILTALWEAVDAAMMG